MELLSCQCPTPIFEELQWTQCHKAPAKCLLDKDQYKIGNILYRLHQTPLIIFSRNSNRGLSKCCPAASDIETSCLLSSLAYALSCRWCSHIDTWNLDQQIVSYELLQPPCCPEWPKQNHLAYLSRKHHKVYYQHHQHFKQARQPRSCCCKFRPQRRVGFNHLLQQPELHQMARAKLIHLGNLGRNHGMVRIVWLHKCCMAEFDVWLPTQFPLLASPLRRGRRPPARQARVASLSDFIWFHVEEFRQVSG